MPRLLVVEQGAPSFRRYILERLVGMGYRLTLLTAYPTVWGTELFEKVLRSRLTSWPRVAALATEEHERDPYSGVFCYNEGGVPLANDLAHLLGLPPVSRFQADAFRHKDRMRIAWEACGVDIPRYRILHRPTDLYSLKTWKFPVVLKPASLMGSNGVVKVDRYEDLPKRVHIPFNADLDLEFEGEIFSLSEVYGLANTVLAEEYVSGPEYSAEGVVIDGQYCLLGITKKYTVDEPYFDEIGHIFPGLDLTVEDFLKVKELLGRAHEALGLRNAFTHSEFRLSSRGPVLMEMGARMGGDHIPRLVDFALQTDTVSLAVRCATGELSLSEAHAAALDPSSPPRVVAAILFLSAPPESYGKVFRDLAAPPFPECEVKEVVTYLSAGDLIHEPLTWGDTRIGHVIFTAPTFDVALRTLQANIGKVARVRYE